VEKGWITMDLVQLKPLPKPKQYGCKVSECKEKHKGKGFCRRHYGLFYRKSIALSGERIKPIIRYPKDFGCTVCEKTGKITKGFCPTHYKQFYLGYIAFDGAPLKPFKRVYRYKPEDRCKIRGCKNRPMYRWYCISHSSMISRGSMAPDGTRVIPPTYKNKGKHCIACGKEAKIRGCCSKHYTQKYKSKHKCITSQVA
jgi:hypothetical protein